MDAESEFLSGLIELQYGQDVEKKLRELSPRVPWAQNWPHDTVSFWNAEAFMWGRKISTEKRDFITKKLSKLKGGRNLDVGCGAYSYIPSVGFDISPKMLKFNENCTEKVEGNIEKKLPFNNKSFDSATAVFLLNYVKNHSQLFREIRRILRDSGTFIAVLSKTKVNEWQRQKEVTTLSADEWVTELKKGGFVVTLEEIEGLLFFTCTKPQKIY